MTSTSKEKGAQTIFVWSRNQETEKPSLVGRLVSHPGRGAIFNYSKSFLQSEDPFALDPVHIPARAGNHTTYDPSGLFSVLNDAGPGDWGKKVLRELVRDEPTDTEAELLLAANGEGVGQLLFSGNPEHCEVPRRRNAVSCLEDIQEAACDIFVGRKPEKVTAEVRYALRRGAGLEGVRPKVYIDNHEGKQWIAKLNTHADSINVALIEHASMRLAAKAGMTVPATQVQHIGRYQSLLIERFDIDKDHNLKHFVSAKTLMTGLKPGDSPGPNGYSYPGIGSTIDRVTPGQSIKKGKEELFRRAAWNVLIGNYDDHLGNHGMLRDKTHGYQISPLYDVLPTPHLPGQRHSIGLVKGSNLSNIKNLLECGNKLNIEKDRVSELLLEVVAPIEDWRAAYASYGVSSTDIDMVSGGFANVEILIEMLGRKRVQEIGAALEDKPSSP
ncbi:type II toxin-antitoxin system HipA family toxin [Alcanivorax sp. 1008]|uniref:type II toxin-antitoxin system HipA family toxin n=1 Tax=Alcanivorax sp. 1008 TaxID=2816853 RepID=UPI001D6BFFF9|nr:type II toxin-antitoxin system HipA family toxin [Alcanivorax sp. 1008]MCC1496825.1 type II toxin-antitoxin system HipA family toxin [Alcanivorax sp. 1008]